MPQELFSPEELSRLLQGGAQLLDVLAREEYDQDHIPGAINVPLKELTAATAAKLDKNRPVVVYCNDFG